MLKARLKVKNYYEVNIGESLSIKCEAVNATSYQWKIKTSTGRKTDTSQTVNIENADFVHQGIYICHALGNGGHDVSEPQVVVVKGEEHAGNRHKIEKIGNLSKYSCFLYSRKERKYYLI